MNLRTLDPKLRSARHWEEMGRTGQWSSLYAGEVGSHNIAIMSRKWRALEMLSREEPGNLLDVGCGPGVLVRELREMGFSYVGMDLSQEMIREAETMWSAEKEVSFQIGDIEKIPSPDNTFDFIACLGVIEYLSSVESAVSEMRRVLKPGGVAIVSNHNRIHLDSVMIGLLKPLRLVISPLFRPLVKKPHDGLRRLLLQPSELDAAMAAAGFVLDEFAFHHFTPIPFPFTVLTPRFAHLLNYRFEDLSRRRSTGFLAHGYVGKYRKQESVG